MARVEINEESMAKLDSNGESKENHRDNRMSYYASGREFYDDDYEEDEQSIDDRLAFNDLRIEGRERDLQLLHDVYQVVLRDGENPSRTRGKDETYIATISGLSGTGKSTLARQFMDELEEMSSKEGGPIKPFFLTGKYDELSGADPFSAIVEAFSCFASTLLEGEKSELQRIQRLVREALGSEANLLTTLIPDLHAVCGDEAATTGSKEHALNKLKYVFKGFSNAISTAQRPVVMFLDDLQWCDSASLELINALLTDNDVRSFMFVGAYRTDEVEDGHDLLKCFQNVERLRPIARIDLVNLNLDELNHFVADALKRQPGEDTKPLTDAVFDKTNGNLFHAMNCLEELQRKGILNFSRMTFEWEWNVSDVDLEEILSDDVLQAVTEKIKSSPEDLQHALTIAAYTRSTFDTETLQKLMDLGGSPIAIKQLRRLLEDAVVSGLLCNSIGSSYYSFAHDRIQQAAHNMIPRGNKRDDFRRDLGQRLYSLSKSEDGEDWMLFSAVDHLNATIGVSQSTFLVKVNLEVGDRAASVSAYDTASKYLGMAQQCLSRMENPWENHYEVTLQIYRTKADVELCQGHYEAGRGAGDQVMKHARTLEDKLPTQLAVCKAIGREEKHQEAWEKSVQALRALGMLPKSRVGLNLRLAKDLLLMRRFFGQKTDAEILSLPLMKDEKLEKIMELLNTGSYHSYYCGNRTDHLLGILRMLRISMKYGICGHTAAAMVGYCLHCNNQNNMKEALRFARLAREVLALTKARELECMQIFVLSHWVLPWKEHREEIVRLYERAHTAGMETGDYENGLWSRTACHHFEYGVGYPLADLDSKYEKLLEKLDVYRLDSIKVMTQEQWRPVQHLRGTAKDPLNFDELEKFGPLTSDPSEMFRLLYGYMGRLELAVYFGNPEFGWKMIEKLDTILDFDKAFGSTTIRLCFSALACASLGRKTERKIFFKKARQFVSQLKGQCKAKGRNGWHRCLLMEAHLRAAESKTGSPVESSYDNAITLAISDGSTHDAALGSQLAAEYFFDIPDDALASPVLLEARESVVHKYINQARDLYLEWGAYGLVKHLETKYAKYLYPTDGIDNPNAVLVPRDYEGSTDFAGIAPLPSLPKSVGGGSGGTKDDMSLLTDHSAPKEGGVRHSYASPRDS